MATFCHFWRISPAQYWDLEQPEYDAMVRLMERVKEDQDRRNRRAAHKRH